MEGKDKIVEDKQKYWDSCATLYDKRIQAISYQPYITLATHTEVTKCKKIIELAIGTGTHTLYIAKTLMQRGATIVCTEIAPKMLELANDKFRDPENEFISFPHNKVNFLINDESLLNGSTKLTVESLR